MCVLLAAVGHILMSDCTVPWWALLAGFVTTGGAGWLVAGRERGPTLIVTLVVGAQTVLHWGFALAQSAEAGAVTGPAGEGMGAMGMGSMSMSSMPMGSGPMSGMHAHSMSMPMHMDMGSSAHAGVVEGGLGHWLASGVPSWGMSGAHLVTAVLCGLWLGYGERVAYRLLRAVAGWLAAPLRLVLTLPALPRRPRRLARRNRSRWVPYRLHLVHAITTRGPPTRTAVV
ncbi:hypothetical protein [Streptomyces sp. NBC_00083]|uniref:hypothetical protein n=1 Tax=Streptomyces sp. NBC_00083 TaxID=2975647 RepID=UPI002B1DF890|nr:hypothetical protein [Streptomyces sp. NBC_00083]